MSRYLTPGLTKHSHVILSILHWLVSYQFLFPSSCIHKLSVLNVYVIHSQYQQKRFRSGLHDGHRNKQWHPLQKRKNILRISIQSNQCNKICYHYKYRHSPKASYQECRDRWLRSQNYGNFKYDHMLCTFFELTNIQISSKNYQAILFTI